MGGAPSLNPKDPSQRRRRNEPERGEIKHATDRGWQHGAVPAAPPKLLKASVEAWNVWFGAWFAFFWTPEDVPGLRHLVRLYDQVERGEFHRAGELRLEMDGYGITPKGQQDRRWRPPKDAVEPAVSATVSHLKVVDHAVAGT
jgi:hypothetical protein